MSSNTTLNFYGLILFIWIVSVLTSPVSNELKTDGTSITTVSKQKLTDAASKNDSQLSTSTIPPVSESINLYTIPNRKDSKSTLLGEGGPIVIESSTESVPPVVSHIPRILGDLSVGDISKESSNAPVTTTRLGTQSKIVARKGANEMIPNVKRTDLPMEGSSAANHTKSVDETTALTKPTHIKEVVTNNDGNNQKIDSTTKHIGDTNANANATSPDTNVLQNTTLANTTAKTVSTTKHKPKPKPTVTIGEPGIDKPIPASPTKSPPLGMPRKIDYIVPVVITIIALPLLGVASFIMYRQGRDCWDKRHYRRMDFLIDGMYND